MLHPRIYSSNRILPLMECQHLPYTEDMKSVELVGIVNVTPDSFSDGGKYFDVDKALKHADEMFRDGAGLVDVGAESTRPKAIPLTANEEWRRLQLILPTLLKRFPAKISLDT